MYMIFEKDFVNPPKDYSITPFWFWNDDLDVEFLLKQLNEMFQKNIYEVIIHAREGMSVDYLSEEWFNAVSEVLDRAKELGMRVWIYDEFNWPSGYAGGKIYEKNSDFAAKCLTVEKLYPIVGKQIEVKEREGDRIAAVVAVHQNKEFYDITDYENGGCKSWASKTLMWEVFIFRETSCVHRPAYSETPYIDLLNKEAVNEFINVTHKEYKDRFTNHWGSTIKGFFTDEPGFYNNYVDQTKNINTIAWTGQFDLFFQKEKGYSIIPFLPTIWEDMGDFSRKTRHDYYEVLTKLYGLSFFKQIHDFLDADGLMSIGHLHREENLNDIVQMEGHFIESMRYLHIPGLDRISRQLDRVTEKLGSSAAFLFGRERCFTEIYGCFGWNLTLDEMKREADLQFVRGVNMIVPHAFFSSIEGVRIEEAPPSEFFQNYYWKYYSKFADYIRRLSYALSFGKISPPVLMYYPITSCWEKNTPLQQYEVRKINEHFIDVSLLLTKNHTDYCYVDDYALKEAVVSRGKVEINKVSFSAIVVPYIYNMPIKTLKVLYEYCKSGGIVLYFGTEYFHGITAEEDADAFEVVTELFQCQNFFKVNETESYKDILNRKGISDIYFEQESKDIKYIHRMDEQNSHLFFITNEGDNFSSEVSFKANGKVYSMNAENGKMTEISSKLCSEYTKSDLFIPKNSSLLIYIKKSNILLDGSWQVALIDKIIPEKFNGFLKEQNLFQENNTFTTLKSLCDLCEIKSGFCGAAIYKKSFFVESFENATLTLDLGKVCDCAEVYINGHYVETLLWQPYQIDITEYVNDGENELSIMLTTTIANSLNGKIEESGLFGPVIIKVGGLS